MTFQLFRITCARFFQLLLLTYFPDKDSQARLTARRLFIISLFIPVFAGLQLMHWIGFLLDDIFFRGYRKVGIVKPVFIVGIPRSGTTLMFQLLSADTERFTFFKLWELLLAPSITERKVIHVAARIDRAFGGPAARLLMRFDRALFRSIQEVHPISLFGPEEDYFALTPILSCLLLILPFPMPAVLGHLPYFDERASADEKRRVMGFYQGILKRHLFFHGPHKRYLSKNPSFSPLVHTLNKTFPDCRIIATARSPFNTIPSLLSSMTEGARTFDNDLQGDAYYGQLLDMLRYYHRHLISVLDRMETHRAVFIPMNMLKADGIGTVEAIYHRFEMHISPEYRHHLQTLTRRARSFRSRHRYSLDQFSLDPDALYEEFRYVFDRFGFHPAPACANPSPRRSPPMHPMTAQTSRWIATGVEP
jgi:omega-hydroxy-beta-dihydromenaquinone-9 sulfotransferase